MSKFKFNGQEHNIHIRYYEALNVLPEKFGINLTRIFVDNKAMMETMNNLLVDDEKAVRLMWFYMEESASTDFDDYLKNLTSNDLNNFREAFWNEVLNFSGPLKSKALSDLWRAAKKELKNMTFGDLHSASPPEESDSIDSP